MMVPVTVTKHFIFYFKLFLEFYRLKEADSNWNCTYLEIDDS